jgi:hypothetical protein
MTTKNSDVDLSHGLNLVADGDIPTTSIIAQVLSRMVPPGFLHIGYADAMDLQPLLARPTIFSRVLDPAVSWVPGFMVGRGARYGYFLDDNFWECDVSPELSAYYADPLRRAALDAFVGRASVVIVNSRFLGDRVKARFPEANVAVVPAHFDLSVLNASQHAEPASGALRVGFAGTTRGDAFAPVTSAIARLLNDFPGGIEFEFIGFVPDTLRGMPGVLHFAPITGYGEFLAFKRARGWHVGLAPLADSTFARSKTNNKFREYGALGIAGLYSNVSPYQGSVVDGVDGILVGPHADDWYSVLASLVHDRARVGRIAEAAHAIVRKVHDVDNVASEWDCVLSAAALRPVGRLRGDALVWRFRNAIGRQRVRAYAYAQIVHDHGLVALARHVFRRARKVRSNGS